jgi:Glycosyltransferase family 87
VSTRALVGAGLAALAASLAIALSADDTGDWSSQAYPAVSALAHGDLGRFFDVQPVHGSVAALVEAPFLALSLALGGGELLAYRLSALPCLLALSALALALGRSMHARGRGPLACVAVSVLVLVNPATLAAIALGHPEELLCAALAVGSVLEAAKGRHWVAAIMLGLAIATKQWALLALGPVLLASAAGARLRLGLTAAAVAAALLAPLALANPDRYRANVKEVQGATVNVSRYSAWWPASKTEVRIVRVGDQARPVALHRLPAGVTALARPATIGLSLALALAAWWRGRRTGDDALALIALALLLRCILDPRDHDYYHVSVLVALLAWESRCRPGLPLLAPLAAVALWASFEQPLLDHAALDNAFYLGWTLVIATSLALWLYGGARPLRAWRGLDKVGRRMASAPHRVGAAGT